MNTPYQWTKQVASHWGGTRNGTIVHWPNGFDSRGEVRQQFHHVIDVAATVLDVAGLPHPLFVNGVAQDPLEGTTMAGSFDQAETPETHTTQYFEMFVNRGIYHEGWTAVTRHSTPWALDQTPPPIEQDVWELYGPDDWTQSRDLAAEMPDKLEELQRLFLIEAARYKVLPLDDRRVERVSAALAGRPTLIQGNTQLLFAGMGRLSEHSVIDIKNRSHSVTAQVLIPDGGANGVIIAQGGAFGGWTVYLLDAKPAYCYNLFGAQLFKVVGESAVERGEHQIRVEFDYDGGGYGKGGNATLFVDGDTVGEVRVDATVPMIFSLDETTDLGHDTATAVTDDLTVKETNFTGRIRWVQIDVGDDAEDADHYISAEERFRIAMAIQ